MLTFKQYRFAPALAPTLAAIVAFPALVSLGLWQLQRADEKRAIEAKLNEAQQLPVIVLNDYQDANLSAQIYRKAEVQGRYDNEHQFLLDNKTHKGRPGYHVLTPFLLAGEQSALLVNRGWIPYRGQRDNIPDISVTESPGGIRGNIRLPGKAILLKQDNLNLNSGHYPQTIQAITLQKMAQALGYPLLPVMLELEKTEPSGYVRDWKPFYGSVGKHTGYAAQWFVMAAILLFLYIKLNTRKVEK